MRHRASIPRSAGRLLSTYGQARLKNSSITPVGSAASEREPPQRAETDIQSKPLTDVVTFLGRLPTQCVERAPTVAESELRGRDLDRIDVLVRQAQRSELVSRLFATAKQRGEP